MFGVDTSELVIVAVLALLFIGPKELPTAMRTVGRWIGQVRGMARHFTSGIEAAIREAELEEMEKKWREENERIMREFPALDQPQMTPTEPPAAAEAAAPDEEPQLPLPQPEKRELP
jgi:sec-independent protein translocase protein TatB